METFITKQRKDRNYEQRSKRVNQAQSIKPQSYTFAAFLPDQIKNDGS